MVWLPSAIRRLKSFFVKGDDSSLPMTESTASADDISSAQREWSFNTENLNIGQWSSIESSVDGSRLPGEMSDEVITEQQRKKELGAMAPNKEGSLVSEGSRRTAQWVDQLGSGRFPTHPGEDGWPNSNVVGASDGEGCSRAPAEDVNRAEGGCTASRDTAD